MHQNSCGGGGGGPPGGETAGPGGRPGAPSWCVNVARRMLPRAGADRFAETERVGRPRGRRDCRSAWPLPWGGFSGHDILGRISIVWSWSDLKGHICAVSRRSFDFLRRGGSIVRCSMRSMRLDTCRRGGNRRRTRLVGPAHPPPGADRLHDNGAPGAQCTPRAGRPITTAFTIFVHLFSTNLQAARRDWRHH